VKVIGAGFGRTGTMSLKVALETLGFDPCYHMTEVFAHPEHTGFWISAWRVEPFRRTKDTVEMRRRLRVVRTISIAVPVTLTLLAGAALVLLRRNA
jgi:hypothetical protein